MSQRELIAKKLPYFQYGVSYRSGDIGDKLFDSSNMLLISGKYITRYGTTLFSAETFLTASNSLSFYHKYDGSTRKIISKNGTIMYAADVDDGIFTSIKTGLTATAKHDAVTMSGRHIIASEGDGLFSYDGTTFAELGISPPSAPSVVGIDGGGTLADKTYTVALTYVATSTGFETNIGTSSAIHGTAGGDDAITAYDIPVSSNPLVDKVNVYLRNQTDSGNYLFVKQINIGVTTTNITENPASNADVPPTGKDPPVSGGAKYLGIFNGQIVAAGNSTFPSDVFFSNADEPDGWSTENSLVHAQGDGPITGLGVGNFASNDVTQYLAIFKRRSITIYYQGVGGPEQDSETFIPGVGCVSHKTIRIKDGNIFFLSDFGWRCISQGRLIKDTLGKGDVDDIFSVKGFVYEINKTNASSAFSVYYSELDSYMTWVAEGSGTSFDKCYNYGVTNGQFMPLMFTGSCCAVTGEDSNGNEIIYIGNTDNQIYAYSIRNANTDAIVVGFTLDESHLDIDYFQTSSTKSIPISLIFNWQPNIDFDATFNFRNFYIESISDSTDSKSTVALQAFLNFNRGAGQLYSYDFFGLEGFTLDVSRLDIDSFGDDRSRDRIASDLNLTGRNILLQITQNVEGARLQLLSSQLNYSRNGNSNI